MTEISGKSQSAICAPYIEKGLANEMRELKLQLDLLEEIKGGSEDNSGKTKTQK